MKPVDFDYERPATLDAALKLLGREDLNAKPLAGSQSLGPMLNLRLVQPELLVDITAIPELASIREEKGFLVLGACVTHAALEDGGTPDPTRGVLARVAAGIAYRAVRNRGTVGGSLAHADPAADWVSVLAALGADVVVARTGGRRTVPAKDFIRGTFETALGPGELVVEIRIPALSANARWGYAKICRKAGEFSHATGVVLIDPARKFARAVIGAVSGPPIVVDDAKIAERDPGEAWVSALFAGTPLGDDAYQIRIHHVALKRAIAEARAP
ncbi:MAG: carbon monoxide dehydrogenase [Rhodospirillales bacterium]|nr:carbon monoxide dehydrogenase [Rhodospirillales bacterium]MSP79530.1 carbon monoxide dehydrogenase [Rhodospirillales bacterium]